MHLDLLHPDTASKVADKREKSIPQKQQGNLLSDKNSAKNFQGSNWLPVQVVKITGPLSYQVRTSEGLILKRHVDHLRVQYPDHTDDPADSEDEGIIPDGYTAVTLPVSQAPMELGVVVLNPPLTNPPFFHTTQTRAPVDCYTPTLSVVT